MDDKPQFHMNGVSQIKIHWKWIWIVATATLFFLVLTGPILWVSSTSRPATVNTGGYTQGADW